MEVRKRCLFVEEKIYWLGWQIIFPGQSKRIWNIVERFGSAREAWFASQDELVKTAGFSREAASSLVRRRKQVNCVAEMARLEKENIFYVHFDDPEYPELLRKIFDPPPGLYVLGKMPPADGIAVAVVGSRRPTAYGVAVAEKIAGDLARSGIIVVSGLARGIDSSAHRGALSAGGLTVAVLGCGVDVVYPRENQRLWQEIVNSGAVVSEFPPGTAPQPWHFPVRNRIISGLSKATVVVEAGEKSGALITADLALEQGREVLAVPGSIASAMSRGPNRLIKNGARLVEGVEDILEEIGVGSLFRADAGRTPLPVLTPEEEKVYQLLSLEPLHLDELINRSLLTPQEVLTGLMYLEIKGLARQLPGKFYVKKGT
jgi:DNA processing protein